MLTVASEYRISACVSREKIFALSDSVADEKTDERLQIVPVESVTTPLVRSDMHCRVFEIGTL